MGTIGEILCILFNAATGKMFTYPNWSTIMYLHHFKKRTEQLIYLSVQLNGAVEEAKVRNT